MKQIKKIAFFGFLSVIAVIGITSAFRMNITEEVISINNLTKQMQSTFLTYDSKDKDLTLPTLEIPVKEEEEKTELVTVIPPVVEEPTVPPVVEKPPVVEEVKPNVSYDKDYADTSSSAVLETVYGSMSGYGPDCYGCTSNRTASGYYVGEGNIYYNDSTFGTVRVVAGDRKYPFGTIIRISNSSISNEPILAIVLDRGGAIGMGKKFMFDLLYASEADCQGVSYNTTFEVLRLGY